VEVALVIFTGSNFPADEKPMTVGTTIHCVRSQILKRISLNKTLDKARKRAIFAWLKETRFIRVSEAKLEKFFDSNPFARSTP
jgi:hypothetical protein